MKKAMSVVLSFAAALMFAGAAFLLWMIPVRAQTVTTASAAQKMFECEGVKDFDVFGGNRYIQVTQSSDTSVTAILPESGADDTHNQITTIKYATPIYLGDNSDEVPFFSFSVNPQTTEGKRDFDALIVTLTDAEDGSNQISVLVGFWNATDGNNWSTVYAKGSGQSYLGYHYANGGGKSLAAPIGQGTIVAKKLDQTVTEIQSFYYDNETNIVYVNNGWASYGDRGGKIPNDAGESLTPVRDLTDVTTSGADSTAYTHRMETAYLSITTVRGWYEYNKIGTSNIYSKNFRGGSEFGHTLSEKGAQYMIRSIDGLDFCLGGTGNKNLTTDSDAVYFASSVSGGSFAQVPALQKYTVLGGISEDTVYTATLFVDVKKDGVPVSDIVWRGLSDGKWTEGCGFTAQSGDYTVEYYSDSEKKNLVASCSISLYAPDFDSAEKIMEPDVFSGGDSTYGWENFRVGNDGTLYSGVTVSADVQSTVVYKKNIDISDNTDEDILLEFIVIPEVYGVKDFTSLTFRFIDTEDENNVLTVTLKNGAYGDAGLSALSAYGSGQDAYGLKHIRTGEYGTEGTSIGQTFAGIGNGSIKYSSIKLYYDKTKNALYASQVFHYSDDRVSADIPDTFVRDFDDVELVIDKEGNKVSQKGWGGFKSNGVRLEITAGGIESGKTAKYGVLTVDGERLTKRLEAEFDYDGISGYVYELPDPVYVNGITGVETDFSTALSGIRVLKGDAEIDVLNGTFTPTAAGEYTVEYAVEENGTLYKASYTLTVFNKEDAPSIEWDFSSSGISNGDVIYMGGSVQGSISASTKLHHDGSACDVAVKILSGSEEVIEEFDNGEYSYVFNTTGKYKLIFTATDKAGRTSTEEIAFTIARTSVELADANDMQTLLDRTEKIVFSSDDIKVSDINIVDGNTVVVLQEAFRSLTVNISYSYKSGGFIEWTEESDLSELGEYQIKYSVSYTLDEQGETYTAEFLRNVNVVDNTPPELNGAKIPEGVKQDDLQASSDSVHYYKALTNSTITIAQLGASDPRNGDSYDLSDVVNVGYTSADGTVSTVEFVDGKYNFTPETAGTYYITYTVSDGALSDKLVYVFDVRDIWMSAAFESDLSEGVSFGTTCELPVPDVTDYNDKKVANAQIEVEIIPEVGLPLTVDNYTFTPEQTGTFTVRYTISCEGEKLVKEFSIVVKDTTAPTLAFAEEVPATVEMGDTVVLPAVTITDDLDTVLDYRIWLEFEGARTELFDLSFKAEKTGTYKIVIETSDTAGNPAQISADIVVTERSGGTDNGWIIGVCCVAGVLVVGGGALAVVLILKKKRKAN